MVALPELNYDYDALGKYISKEIMTLHHRRHHQSYIDKLNKELDLNTNLKNKSVESLLRNLDDLPKESRMIIRNNGGGHYNHTQFWLWMSPSGGGEPKGKIKELILNKFGNFQEFINKFTEQSVSLFGSGWVWLLPNLEIVTTPNQDNPIMNGQNVPILGLDVWEHAYYLDYKNKRDDYVSAWWNIVNWDRVEELYSSINQK